MPVSGIVSIRGRAEIAQIGSGSVPIRTNLGVELTLENVMHVPDVDVCYFSVTVLLEKKGRIIFENNGFSVYLQNKTLAKGYIEGRLFWFDVPTIALHMHTRASTSLEIWHKRMGHMSYNALKQYSSTMKGMEIDGLITSDPSLCPGCELGKQMRQPFPASSKQLERCLQIIHSDLASLMQVQSIQGAQYIVTFIDDYSRHGVVYSIKSKDQCTAAFKKFLAWAENQTSEHMLTLHSDRGGEYISRVLQSQLSNKGIEHCLTMPGTPQQNGLAEQWNCTLMDKVRAMIHSTGLSLGFWELAVDTAVHIYNRSPTHTIGWKTPHKLWSAGHTPDISYMCVFGCKAFVHVPEDKQRKLDP
jgi:hypothetical protein